ncbi:MAG: hypothetical protein K9J13_05000 [Saprospiraceae bacterium]|nr:hypothetical protein [Saprospiraceae bacterium]
MKFISTIIFSVFLFSISYSQIEPRFDENYSSSPMEWQFGMNFGFYFANKATANYYNGSDKNENKIQYILGNKYRRDEITRELNVVDSFALKELPTQMKYAPAVMVGFYTRGELSKTLGIVFQFNFQNLKTTDYFTIERDPPIGYLREPDLILCPIYGEEKRINIDVGISKIFRPKEKVQIFVEGGFNMNNTKVVASKIQIENLEYSLVNVYLNQNYVPNSNLQEYTINQGGIGFGTFLSSGVKLNFSDAISVDPGATLYWKSIHLEGYDYTKLHYSLYVRMIFKLSFESEP